MLFLGGRYVIVLQSVYFKMSDVPDLFWEVEIRIVLHSLALNGRKGIPQCLNEVTLAIKKCFSKKYSLFQYIFSSYVYKYFRFFQIQIMFLKDRMK